MQTWGVVTTLKAPYEQILAFVAWHLGLGAAEMRLFFDNPDDPSLPKLAALNIPQLHLTPCTAAWWEKRGGRPDGHQSRQTKNARAAMRQTTLPWLAHIDIDEFILPKRAIGAALDEVPPTQLQYRMEPFEALHDPTLPDDIQTARHFRAGLRHASPELRELALGEWAGVIPEGMLSHRVGKVFFRADVAGVAPRIHGAFFEGQRITGLGFSDDIQLLHFHAQNHAQWEAARPRRARVGAYKFQPDLQDLLADGSPEEIHAFYLRTQTLAPKARGPLLKAGRLIETDLRLREKVAALLAAHGQPPDETRL